MAKIYMVSKNQLKFIKSLKIKKHRTQEKSFLVEGRKNVFELLSSDYIVDMLLVTEQFYNENVNQLSTNSDLQVILVTEEVLADAGTFVNNKECLAVARMKHRMIVDIYSQEHIVALDGINDPGNLGTIIRTLDWFGMNQIICSKNTVDWFNPKVINATMGAFTRMDVIYEDLEGWLRECRRPIYGANLDGENPRNIKFDQPSVLVMGSESHGISPEVTNLLHHQLTIPKFGDSESLNVGIATGILAYLMKTS